MRVKYEYAGNSPRPQYLLVFLEVVIGRSHYSQTLKIPWSELSDQNVLYEIDKQVRRELNAHWAPDDAIDFPAWEE